MTYVKTNYVVNRDGYAARAKTFALGRNVWQPSIGFRDEHLDIAVKSTWRSIQP